MSRIPQPSPDELDQEQRALYESILGGPRATSGGLALTDERGGLLGPFNAMLLHPPIGDALQRLGAAIRFRGTLSDRARELAILTVARHWGSTFERRAHERIAREAGLTESEIAALRTGAELELADADEAAVVRTVRLLLTRRSLTDTEYAEAAATLGAARLFELSTLVGYYSLLALQMHVFGVQ